MGRKKGVPLTPEQRERHREGALRMWQNPEYPERQQEAQSGPKHSPESKERIRQGVRRYYQRKREEAAAAE